MAKPKRPLAEFVEVDTSSARADRMWSALRGRLPASAKPTRRWAVARPLLLAATLVLAFGAGWLFSRQAPRSGWAQLQTATGVTSVHLQDGSSLTLAPHTSLSVQERAEHGVQLALDTGRVECEVTHDASRIFSVAAAGHEVRVLGTSFSVELSQERNELAVEVQRGRVEVRQAGAANPEALLLAGQRWSVPLKESAKPSSRAGDTPGSSSTAAASVAVPDAGAPPPQAVPRPTAEAARVPGARGERASPARAAVDERARLLLDRGNAARRGGDLAAAAQAYEQLLKEHPKDLRAGLAAFELGRLRMDEFHDVHGAIQALQLAVRAANETGLREDAMARLVRAHEILKDAPRCRAARGDYLESYPTGTHALTVLQACEGL